MPVSRENNIWGRIRTQLKEAQEMILNGRYADAMVQNRELLRMLVSMQMDQACLVTRSLQEDIAQLAEGHWISRQTRDNYQTIRILGDQAAAGQNQSAQDANTSFFLLKDALETFVDQNSRPVQERGTLAYERNTQAEERTERSQRPARRSGAQNGRSTGQRSRNGARSSGRNNAQRSGNRRRQEEAVSANIYDILKIIIPVVCVILLIILIRSIWSGGNTAVTETTVESSVAETTAALPETETETEAETEAVGLTYVTIKNANLRTAPSTGEDSVVIRIIPQGTEIQLKGEYDSEWMIMDENGTDAYISKTVIAEQTAAETSEAAPETQAAE